MCGITGIVSQFGAKGYVKERSLMIHALRHRGPDAMDEWYKPGVQLGHTRLSIIDLSEGGNQPKTDYSFRYTITFNGEIYNYKELKLKLKQYPFQTQSDTEVILAAYSYWGYETPKYLKGQFAFAIWDDHKRELFLARDRMGEKPLYYYVADGVLVFASEMRALLGTGLVPKKVSLCGVYDYLLYQSVASPNTIIENVFQLKQGHFAIYTNSTLKSYKYYDICEIDREVAAYTYEETTKNISDLLTKAVEGQMVSDVPLGAFLSGGIDSSVIVGIMASISTAPVHTVSVTFDEAKYDESRYSDLISKRFNTNHTKLRLKASDFLLDLDRYFADLDVPSGDGPNTWMVSRATKKTGLTVALSGLGGDELFAGYKNFTRYIALKDNLWFWKLPVLLRTCLTSLAGLLPSRINPKLVELVAKYSLDDAEIYGIFRQSYSRKAASTLLEGILCPDSVQINYQGLNGFKSLPNLSQYSVLELINYTQNVLLKDTDIMAMAHSLEVRVPFFDHDLVRFVLSVPDKFKFPTSPKKLLTDSLNGLLPDEIIYRPKMGFTFPWHAWLRNDLKRYSIESLEVLKDYDLFDEKSLTNIISGFQNQRDPVSWNQIWLLVVMSKWFKTNILE